MRPTIRRRIVALTLLAALAAAGAWTLYDQSDKAPQGAFNGPTEPLPSLLAALRAPEPLAFCGESVPLDQPEVRERFEKEMLLRLWDRPQTILWIKRAGRYFPRVQAALWDNGLPDDLKYLAVIESSLNPDIGSSKGALGLWQFIAATGTRHGLSVNATIDERRNPHAATEAATRYLKRLYGLFGSWTMAAAAYNMGENGLKEAAQNQDMADYYRLYLPNETMQYVIRAVVAKRILSNPARYGYALTGEDLYEAPTVERLVVTCPRRVHVTLVAKAALTTYKTIKELNPEILGQYLDKGAYTLSVPPGGSLNFGERFEALLGQTTPANP